MLPTKIKQKRGTGKKYKKHVEENLALSKEVRDILDKNVKWNQVAKSLYASSIGVKVRGEKYGKEVIYDKPPCTDASRVLLEFRFGKPSAMLPIDAGGLLGVIGIPIMESDNETNRGNGTPTDNDKLQTEVGMETGCDAG